MVGSGEKQLEIRGNSGGLCALREHDWVAAGGQRGRSSRCSNADTGDHQHAGKSGKLALPRLPLTLLE